MTVRSLLAEQLRHTCESGVWQPPLFVAVEGLSPEQAAWKPGPGRHSIWEIVRHLLHWKRFVLELWDGRQASHDDWERRDWAPFTVEESAWPRDVKELKEMSKEIAQRVADLSDRDLGSTFPYWNQPLSVVLADMASHDAYHAGQVQLLRALQTMEG
ncbi:MAG: DinB family protein [Candidatus Bipolaricaulota bacterium]